jgi:hypothetical protein
LIDFAMNFLGVEKACEVSVGSCGMPICLQISQRIILVVQRHLWYEILRAQASVSRLSVYAKIL